MRTHVRTFAPVLDGSGTPSSRRRGRASARPGTSRPTWRGGTATNGWRCIAEQVAGHTYELSELLVDVLGLTDVGAWFPHTVTYHPTCHSVRLLGVGERPLRLLRAVDGLELRELREAEQCCGFGGTFALKNSETSAAMVTDKAEQIEATGAEVVTAGDWSCLLNISGALDRRGTGVRAAHLAEILAATHDEPWGALEVRR